MPLLAVRSLYILHRLPLRPFSAAFHTSGIARTMATVESLAKEIEQQSAHLVTLRKQQAEDATVEEAKKKLGELKKSLALLKGGSSKDAGKKKERLLLKTAKVRVVVIDG